MAPRKCCCNAVACELGRDDFNRADSTNVGPLWSEESGDWAISGNKLVCVTPGTLATTICHPPSTPLGSFVADFTLANVAAGSVYRFRAGNPASSPIEGEVSISVDGFGVYFATASLTNITTTETWTYTLDSLSLDEIYVRFCYVPGLQSTLTLTQITNLLRPELSICISDSGADYCHAGLGNFSFLEGDFDDWVYSIHYVELASCPNCECMCESTESGIKRRTCYPKQLTLTIVNPADCPNIPASYTLYQQEEFGGDDLVPYDPPTITVSPAKVEWISDEIALVNTFTPPPDQMYFRWKLRCISSFETTSPRMELQLMLYVAPGDTQYLTSEIYLGFDDTYPETIDSININSRTHAGTLSTSTCDPIILRFPPFREYLIAFGLTMFLCYPGGWFNSSNPDGDNIEFVFEVEITE